MDEINTEAKHRHLCKGVLPLNTGGKVTSLAKKKPQKPPPSQKKNLITNKKPSVKSRKKILLGIEFSFCF